MATTRTTKTTTAAPKNPDSTVQVKVIFKITLPNLPKANTPTMYSSRKRFRKVLRKAGYSIKNFEVIARGNTLTIDTVKAQAEPEPETTTEA